MVSRPSVSSDSQASENKGDHESADPWRTIEGQRLKEKDPVLWNWNNTYDKAIALKEGRQIL